MSDVNLQNGRQFAVSCGLETKSAPFTTVTSAFYAYSRLLRSSAIAVWDLSSNKKGRKITYQSLASHAQALSRHLAKLGVGRGHRIPLIATQGLESVVGILAVLSCGAQFIPIDYNLQTDDYIRATVAWSGQAVVLSTSPAADDVLMRLFANTLEVVRIYSEAVQFPNLEHYPATHDQANADDICYTTFTSDIPPSVLGGGREVRIKHKSVSNLVCLWPGNLGVRPGLCVGQLQSISSDLAVWEIFGCLCNGGTLIIGSNEPEIAFREIQVLITTPMILSNYAPGQLPSLEVVAAVGEAVSDYLADLWAAHVGAFWNCYGSSETTIACIMSRHVRPDDFIPKYCQYGTFSAGCPVLTGRDGLAPIGSPIPNTYVYILDGNGRQRPVGLVGSIWVGGAGVCNDYVGYEPESYALNPFLDDESYIYRTGDYGFCNEDGSIELSPPVFAEDFAKSGHGLSRVELQRVKSSLHCAASSAADTPQVAVLAFGPEIHCFVVQKPGLKDADASQIELNISQSMEQHMEILCDNKLFPTGAYISQIHPVDKRAGWCQWYVHPQRATVRGEELYVHGASKK
ncbi:AMP-binding enzyme [Metarhizium robertsii]|uniref:AMP-binding enzyme n=1 Tax=Metarhizium robertsii TaxID=568076 RepID=A0A014QPX3_9HYPO|nr:AMP-binding enzyme [Metarhizium robertsii]